MKPVSDAPNPVDIHVGQMIRNHRKALGLTQDALAQALSLTFQQVQKYERGVNRVSASKLYEISRALKVPPGSFFDALGDGGEARERSVQDRNVQESNAHRFLLTAEGVELAEAFPRVRDAKVRRKIADLIRVVAAGGDSDS